MTTRIPVKKTYKAYLGGKFIRSESGRSLVFKDKNDKSIAAYPQCSRKDFRNAVVAAEKCLPAWQKSSAYLKGQIIYRIGEMLESRRDAFTSELQLQGFTTKQATKEVDESIDRLVYYAGWSDKYQQIFSSVNPVASPHFNFSTPEPTGIIAAFVPEDTGLLGLVDFVARVIVGGNSIIAIASNKAPLTACSFGEVLNSSDVPAGLVNILTVDRSELIDTVAGHMNVQGILCASDETDRHKKIQTLGADNLKRLRFEEGTSKSGDPYRIMDFQEIKTTWHPVSVN